MQLFSDSSLGKGAIPYSFSYMCLFLFLLYDESRLYFCLEMMNSKIVFLPYGMMYLVAEDL